MNLRRNVLLAPLLCVKKILLAHHPPSVLHTSQQRSNGRSAIELALQQVQRAGKHSWIQEKGRARFASEGGAPNEDTRLTRGGVLTPREVQLHST